MTCDLVTWVINHSVDGLTRVTHVTDLVTYIVACDSSYQSRLFPRHCQCWKLDRNICLVTSAAKVLMLLKLFTQQTILKINICKTLSKLWFELGQKQDCLESSIAPYPKKILKLPLSKIKSMVVLCMCLKYISPTLLWDNKNIDISWGIIPIFQQIFTCWRTQHLEKNIKSWGLLPPKFNVTWRPWGPSAPNFHAFFRKNIYVGPSLFQSALRKSCESWGFCPLSWMTTLGAIGP